MTRTSRVILAAAVCAGALAVGCSKTATGPTDPFVGSWTVTIQNLVRFSPPDSGPVAPFTLTVAKSGQTYSASFPTLIWSLATNGSPLQLQFPASSAGQSSIQLFADTLAVQDDASQFNSGCLFYFSAAFTGARNIAGYAWIECSNNEVGLGQLTATKQ